MNGENLNLARYYINEYIDDYELMWQLKELKDKGFNGLIVSPAKGLSIGFMSPEWISIISLILSNSEELGLKVYLSTDAVNPTNVLEMKYDYREPQYKLFYLTLKEIVDISEASTIKVVKHDRFYTMKKGNDGKPDPTTAVAIDIESPDLQKMASRDLSVVHFCIDGLKRTPNDLYQFNFLEKNIKNEYIKKIYKKCTELFKEHTSFAGFYEPRLFPKLKIEGGIACNNRLVSLFREETGIELYDIIPEIFFSEITKYQNIREKYEKFLRTLYKENFIDVVESFIEKNNLEIIYQFDTLKKSGSLLVDYFDFSPLYDLTRYIRKESFVAFYLPYVGNTEVDIMPALSFQSLKSLGIVDRSIAIITDKHHRFNFTPHRYLNLKKNALMYNTENSITESFLYSIKGFRKNDIVPNVFYQNRFWKYMKDVNQQFDRIYKTDFLALDNYEACYDLIIVFSNIEQFNKYSNPDCDYTYFYDFVNTVVSAYNTVFVVPSDQLDNLKLKKSNNKFSFVYCDNGKTINTERLIMIHGKSDIPLERWYEKNSSKAEILKIYLDKEKSSKVKIFDKDVIYNYLTNYDELQYKITVGSEGNVFVEKLFSGDNIKYLLFNPCDTPRDIIFTDRAGKNFIHQLKSCELKVIDKRDIPFTKKIEKNLSSYKVILKNNWQFNSNETNILPLTQWLFKVGGPKDELIGTVHYFETSFVSNILPSKLFLILDGVYGEKDYVNIDKPVKIFVNNKEVDYNATRLKEAHTLYKLDICKHIVRGENKIVIKSKGAHFSPISLNEPQFIEGDFAVRKKVNGVWVIDKTEKPLVNGNWVENGYPFYLGVGEFTQFFELDKNFKKIELKITNYDYPLEVNINGEFVQAFSAPPYECDVTKFVTEGRNKLLLMVPSSVVNIFTGIKLPEGMTGEVSFEVYH